MNWRYGWSWASPGGWKRDRAEASLEAQLQGMLSERPGADVETLTHDFMEVVGEGFCDEAQVWRAQKVVIGTLERMLGRGELEYEVPCGGPASRSGRCSACPSSAEDWSAGGGPPGSTPLG